MSAADAKSPRSRATRARTRCEVRLAYEDENAALAFLTATFGFSEQARIESPGGALMAWLSFGHDTLMIGGSGPEHHNLFSPRLTGKPTAEVNVRVDDIDGHFHRATAAGAAIIIPLEDAPLGQRHYRAVDPEGHAWHIMKPRRDLHTESATIEGLELRLSYADDRAALAFLTAAYGFQELARIKNPDGTIMAWLGLDDAVVMLGPAGPDHGQHRPAETGRPTAMINLIVDEIDLHYERAVAAGADIVTALENTPWGIRRYEAVDPEGNRWYVKQEF